jgi:hypothetical protein
VKGNTTKVLIETGHSHFASLNSRFRPFGMPDGNEKESIMPELQAATTIGTRRVLAEAVVRAFKTGLRGPVLCSGDDDYDGARTVYNAMIDRRPALIARCLSAADVVACVQFARTHNLLTSVRGGGHSVAGNAYT